MTQDLQRQLEEISIFAEPPSTFGMPSKLFWALVMVAVGEGVLLRSVVLTVVVFLLLFAPLYRAHRTDPNAADVWRAALARRINAIDPALTRSKAPRFI